MSEDTQLLAESLDGAHLHETTTATTSTTPTPESLPRTILRSYMIQSIHTDLFVQVFDDRVVIGCSQLNTRIGQWLLCEFETSPHAPTSPLYEITTLLGNNDDTWLSVMAKAICETIQKTIVLGVSLQTTTSGPATVMLIRALVDLIVKLHQEAVTTSKNT
jgi:hypothetical protein